MARPTASTRPRMARGREAGRQSRGNRKVKPPRKTHTGIWLVVMVLFFAQALLYVWCRVQCVNAGYGIESEMRRRQALTKERNTLDIEMARLKSPERIETIARTRLGLVMPDAQQTVTLP